MIAPSQVDPGPTKEKYMKKIIGALSALLMAVALLFAVPATQDAEAAYSSPSDCSIANGWYTFEYTGYGFWWDSNAETTTNYWAPGGYSPRNPMPNACLRYGYAPTWQVGFFTASDGTPATSDTAYYHNGDGRAYDRRSAYCGMSWNHCKNWTSWHAEKWAWNTAYPFVHYNF